MYNEIPVEVIQTRLDRAIKEHGPNARKAIIDLMEQGRNMKDHLVPANKIHYTVHEGNVVMIAANSHGGLTYTMHDNAISQLSKRFDLPAAYVRDMARSSEPWQKELAVHILDEHGSREPDGNVLIRAVKEEVRAVVSDKFKTMDMTPIFAAFADEAHKVGAVLMDGHLSDLKGHVEVVVPTLHRIVTTNNGVVFIAFGAQIVSSDFGASSLNVKEAYWQGVCTNMAVGMKYLRRAHLGSRLTDTDFTFSQETQRKDALTMASAVRDITTQALSQQTITNRIEAIKKSSEVVIDMPARIENLPKIGMTKEEAELVNKVLLRSSPEDGVTGEPTIWKLQQAITAVARELEPVRMREVQEIAGTLV